MINYSSNPKGFEFDLQNYNTLLSQYDFCYWEKSPSPVNNKIKINAQGAYLNDKIALEAIKTQGQIIYIKNDNINYFSAQFPQLVTNIQYMTLYYQHIGDMEAQNMNFVISKNVAFPLMSVYLTVGIVGGIILCIIVMCVIVRIRNMRMTVNNARMLRQNRIPKKQVFLPNVDKQMKIISYSYSESKYGEKYCTICLVEFNAAEKIQEILVCSHIFHIDCIKQWIHSQSKQCVLCPNCNKSIIP